MIKREYYPFKKYCEDNNIKVPFWRDYEEYIDYCEENKLSFDVFDTRIYLD